nr:replication-associated protein [Wheat yellow stripe virus]
MACYWTEVGSDPEALNSNLSGKLGTPNSYGKINMLSFESDYSQISFTPREVLLMLEGEDALERITEDMPEYVQWHVVFGSRCYAIWEQELPALNPLLQRRSTFARRWRNLISAEVGPISLNRFLDLFRELIRFVSRLSRSSRDLIVPGVSVDGALIHVDVTAEPMSSVYLLAFLESLELCGKFWVGAQTAASMIDAARAIEGPNTAMSEMVEAFHLEVKSSVVVAGTLVPMEKKRLERELGFIPIYKPRHRSPRNHAVLASLREVLRQEYESSCRVANTKLRTLVVGAACREVVAYSTNPAIHYYFANKESKDTVRITLDMLGSALSAKYSNMEAGEKALMNNLKANGYIVKRQVDGKTFETVDSKHVADVVNYAKNIAVSRSQSLKSKKSGGVCKPTMTIAVERTIDLHRLAESVAIDKKIPGHFHFTEESIRETGFTQLVCEDVGYNFSTTDWLHLFDITGAATAVGYMALPNELLFEHYPPSDYYDYWEATEERTINGGVKVVPKDYGQVPGMPKGVFRSKHFNTPTGVPGAFSSVFNVAHSRVIAHMTDGLGNGYTHGKDEWSTLLKHPILQSSKYDFAIEVDLTGRYGVLVSFRLTRITGNKYVARSIALRPEDRFVRVLDLLQIVRAVRDKGPAGLKEPYQFFPVHRREVDTALTYCFTVAEKSLTVQNICNFVRHHVNGVALVNKELVTAGRINPRMIASFSYAVYFYILNLRGDLDKSLHLLMKRGITWKERLLAIVADFVNNTVRPIEFLWTWLYEKKLVDQIFIDSIDVHYQNDSVYVQPSAMVLSEHLKLTKEFMPADTLLPEGMTDDEWLALPESVKVLSAVKVSSSKPELLCAGIPYTDVTTKLLVHENMSTLEIYLRAGGKLQTDVDFSKAYTDYFSWHTHTDLCACPVCSGLHEIGDQVVECRYLPDSNHTFAMSQSDIDSFRNEVLEQSLMEGNRFGDMLGHVHELLPKTAFEVTVRIEYIKGGPGTGKSYIIRKLADPIRDLIVAPFLKLRSDYQNQNVNGQLVSWEFHTQHKALEKRGYMNIFVDEFTAYDWRLLAVLAHQNQAQTIYLVGDEQQTGIIESKGEGVSIINRIDLGKVSTHVPVKNFRNPLVDVKVLNYLFGTKMIPTSKLTSGISFDDINNFEAMTKQTDVNVIHYSDATGLKTVQGYQSGTSKTTVRANQGSTYDKVLLPILPGDYRMTESAELTLVAMSRHRQSITIFIDNEGAAVGLKLLSMIKNAQLKVSRPDYTLRMYLGMEMPINGDFFFPESGLAKAFRSLISKYDGYLPYDDDTICAPPGDCSIILDVSAIENEVALQYSDFTRYNLAARENNCLPLALSEAMGMALEHMHYAMMNADNIVMKEYVRWLQSGLSACWTDCVNFSKGLHVSVIVFVQADPDTKHECLFSGNTVHAPVRLLLLGERDDGHFVVAPCSDEEVITECTSPMTDMSASSSGVVSEDIVSVVGTLVRSNVDANISNEVSMDEYSPEVYEQLSASLSGLGFAALSGGKSKRRASKPVVLEPMDELRHSFMDYASEFVPILIDGKPIEEKQIEYRSDLSSIMVPEFDAIMAIKEFDLDCGADQYLCNYLNEPVANRVEQKFVTGILDPDIVAPLNMRGHPIDMSVKYHSMGVAPAQLYFKKNYWQELQVQQARYLFRKVKDSPSFTQKKVAKLVADLFINECLVADVATTFMPSNLASIMDRSLRDMLAKNYQGQMEEEFTRNARVYRFQLKDIEKPLKDSTVDLAKAGQGILAWSKEAHVKFMVAFRVINDLMLKSVKDNVIYDNSMNEEEVVQRINEVMAMTPDAAVNGVIDAAACDSGQGKFTQLIERYIYEGLGLSEYFLDWYFSFRESYVMQSRFVRAPMSYVKTSGEPGTLLGNTILMGAMMNAMLRGQGPFCMVIKGDDGFKRQANLHVNTDMLKLIKHESVLDFKLDLNVPVNFCGYALTAGNLFPSVSRKLTKICAHRFRDYEHFCEYQESLRDWVKRIPKDPSTYAKLLECNAGLTDRGMYDVQRWIDGIVSVSRIGREQFYQFFPLREFDLSEPPQECIQQTKVNIALGSNVFNYLKTKARYNTSC